MLREAGRIDGSGNHTLGDQFCAMVVGTPVEQGFQDLLTDLPGEIPESAESFAAFVV